MPAYLHFLTAATLVSSYTVQGQCPLSVANNAITSCDEISKVGTQIYIDFYRISSPCTCTVIPSISGYIYIKTETVTVRNCATTIKVGSTLIYTCPTNGGLSSLKVIANQPVTVTASYQPFYNAWKFYHCLRFGQSSDDVNITCGPSLIEETTTAQISSTGIDMTVSSTHQENELIQVDDVSNLRIPVAVFAVTAVVALMSVTFNIYLFIKSRQRNINKSKQEQNTSLGVNQSLSNQSSTGPYTELDMTNITRGAGNQGYTELDTTINTTRTMGEEDQYDVLPPLEN